MASMGSLGHYMQEASRSGFAIRDFLHEGNGDIWLAALESPYPFADWVLIEEKAEGGDMLARIARERPTFLDGYERVCEGAGVALYRRAAKSPTTENTDTNEGHCFYLRLSVTSVCICDLRSRAFRRATI